MQLDRPIDPAELDILAAEWGPPPRLSVALAVDSPFLTGPKQKLVSNGRRGEICFVMHRGSPAGGVLLEHVAYYPAGVFRLPTGGIHAGEGVIETLAREIAEETGLTVGRGPQDVAVERLLGVVDYTFHHATLGRAAHYATYAFLVRMPQGALLDPQDPEEQLADWRWLPAGELAAAADALEGVGAVAPEWGDWGRYRAVAHRFVAAQLTL